AQAQDKPAKNQRTVFVVRHANAKNLAELLGKHFQGVTEIQVLADAPSNCLLINAPPKAFAEVVKVLEQLDRRPQLIAVEVWVAHLAPKKGEVVNEKQFNGPEKAALEKLKALQKEGVLRSLRRMQITAAEN